MSWTVSISGRLFVNIHSGADTWTLEPRSRWISVFISKGMPDFSVIKFKQVTYIFVSIRVVPRTKASSLFMGDEAFCMEKQGLFNADFTYSKGRIMHEGTVGGVAG